MRVVEFLADIARGVQATSNLQWPFVSLWSVYMEQYTCRTPHKQQVRICARAVVNLRLAKIILPGLGHHALVQQQGYNQVRYISGTS